MIPTEKQIRELWEKYDLPDNKRIHATLVAKVADFLARRLIETIKLQMNLSILRAAALLHDIDKNVPKLPGEVHPDACVRILRAEGMGEVADIVKTHSVHAILDPAIAPKTWEEKLLFLADKMAKREVIGVDERFFQWEREDIPEKEKAMLAAAYPRVKALEKEILAVIQVDFREVLSILRETGIV
jgi:putative nucleotidyltransferase with HDIG domain